MKRIFAVLTALVMTAALVVTAIPAFAATSFAPNGEGWDPDEVITVKKADPKNVVKDGVIGNGEYERYYADLDGEDECTSPLFVVAFNGASIDNAFAMLKTMEYYFSWDETHGFNFAVRNKPAVVQQLLEVRPEGDPQDDFARNTAYVIDFKTDDGDTCLFYALGRRTDTLEYLEGYYTSTPWIQLGARHNYDPVAGVDYVINYGADGYVTIEWSIPFEDLLVAGGGAGSKLEGTISATAGTAVVPFGGHAEEDSYAITLGDFGYGVDVRSMKNHVHYDLSAEEIEVGGGDVTGPTDDDTVPTDDGTAPAGDTDGPAGDTSDPVDSDAAPAPSDGGEGGNNGGGNNGGGNNGGGGNAAPKTGDPMIVMAAVAAVSAAGAAIVAKKRH